jgi:hypothetical protein
MAKKRADTPPYVPRKGLRTVLDHVQSRQAGEVVTREELHKRGLSAHLTYPALAALRFIGLLDEKDHLTGKHGAFNRETPDRAAQEALVREAYSDFFEAVPLPAADLEALKGKFQKVYELSDRVINSAFPLFQSLAQDAGILLVEGGAQAPIADEQRHVVHPSAHPLELGGDMGAVALDKLPAGEEPLRIKHTGYQIVINLQVTKHTTEKDVIKMVRTANRAIHLLKKAGDSR